VLQRLQAASVEAAAHVNGLSVVLTERMDPARLEVFSAGLVQPQDAAATAVVAASPVRPGMRVLDLCAAPGTKTTHLAERMHNRGQIIASDVSADRLARIQANCRRMGADIVQTVLASELAAQAEQPFDLVLVDAPCTNTGVLARRPEARWRFSPEALRAASSDQRGLLLLGVQLVGPGGACVYSTCSLEREENRQVVTDVLSRRDDLKLAEEHVQAPAGADEPTGWYDGGYFAILRHR
jgi:16S rRNA (cytosine967-C5)-methyltransferase